MDDLKVGDLVYYKSTCGYPLKNTIKGIDIIDGIKKYWLTENYGYHHRQDLYKTPDELIDYMIEVLERYRTFMHTENKIDKKLV